ncbi:MAG: glycerol-3-phosphate dehydrogenase/oxidase [Pseudomonadota bacterium]
MLADHYDLVVVGGGITGAGIFREAVKTGARVLLVEKNDYASGTSSWSSKLVHGGLRYLKTGEWRLTLESVRERQRLMNEAPGLVERQPFLMPIYQGRKPGKVTMRLGLWLYDRMAGVASSRWLDDRQTLLHEPHLRQDGLLGAVAYDDARTDDARLVLRLIFEAVGEGGTACNYTAAQPWRERNHVRGISLADGRRIETAMVINATGVFAGDWGGASPKLRPLRGSHFVFPIEKLPIQRAVSWLHPKDQRPVFVYPWQGAALYGTTDLDHDGDLHAPRMSQDEARYLLDGLAHQFPSLRLTAGDAISTYAGIRPVVASGKHDPSAESRESAMWSEPGLVGITGGKLTTFRVTARQALREAAKQRTDLAPAADESVFKRSALVMNDWEQLRHSARNEQVHHLDDLMMRRTRMGLLLPQGGEAVLDRVAEICRSELGWDDARWQQEKSRYLDYWQRQHSPEHLA